MNTLQTIMAVVAGATVLGGLIAWVLHRGVIQTSQEILRATNKDLIQRLEIVEVRSRSCETENANLQIKIEALQEIVTNKDLLLSLIQQMSKDHKTTMAKLASIQKEARSADVAAKKRRRK